MFHATHAPPLPDPDNQPEDAASASKPPRSMLQQSTHEKVSITRVRDVEITFPIVYGSIAWYLGKKTRDGATHKWTAYVRSATNEDLGAVIKRVEFRLHKSFSNPERVVDSPPFELTESGWGEFEILMSVCFHDDVCDKEVHLFHIVRLFPQDHSVSLSPKRPVVVETYDEIVFPNPTENLLARLWGHPAVIVSQLPPGLKLHVPVPVVNKTERKNGDTKDHSLSRFFAKFSDDEELSKIMGARRQVQAHIFKLTSHLSMIDGLPQA